VPGSSPGEHHLWTAFNSDDGTELRARPVDDCRYIDQGIIEAGTWKRVRIPLSELNAAERSLSSIFIQNGGEQTTAFWVDEIRLVAATDGHGAELPVYLPAVVNAPKASRAH